ncbi:hypothetical protein BDQ17DRAFT_845304 [Cyathus striatus]|nr:hypothetical protein BDQ17DRAFT_845304 [Cyathus striatus]
MKMLNLNHRAVRSNVIELPLEDASESDYVKTSELAESIEPLQRSSTLRDSNVEIPQDDLEIVDVKTSDICNDVESAPLSSKSKENVMGPPSNTIKSESTSLVLQFSALPDDHVDPPHDEAVESERTTTPELCEDAASLSPRSVRSTLSTPSWPSITELSTPLFRSAQLEGGDSSDINNISGGSDVHVHSYRLHPTWENLFRKHIPASDETIPEEQIENMDDID